jgi:Phage tail sheath C-terminal domain
MATVLGSPGISVQVIDESFYTPAAPGSTPLIFVASAANKSNSSKTGTAEGTLEANAGSVYIVTSQRDLTDTFGTPLFYTDASSNPINGDELNEYGLQAAYSLLGISSQAYVVRANIDLGQLAPSTTAPEGAPVSGTYWVNPSTTSFGINEWSSSTQSFSVVTPLVIDNGSFSADTNVEGLPADGFGKPGDYAVIVTSDNGATMPNALYYKTSASSNAWIPVEYGFDGGKELVIAPHTSYPDFTSAANGSIWVKTTAPGKGSNWSVQYYNGATSSWTSVLAPVYNSNLQATYNFDYAGGGANIPVGTVYVETDPDHYGLTTATTAVAEFRVWRYNSSGATTIQTTSQVLSTTSNKSFVIRESIQGLAVWANTATITVPSDFTNTLAANIATQINVSGLQNVKATYNTTTNVLTISHVLGGDIELFDYAGTPLADVGFSAYSYDMETMLSSGTANLYTAPMADLNPVTGAPFTFLASNWKPLVYEASSVTPSTPPADGTLWFDSSIGSVDILYNNGSSWVGYLNAFPTTDPNGPIISALAPTTQSDGSPLVTGDIWVSTADVDSYGKVISVYNGVTNSWVLQDTTDHYSPTGWVYADARWTAGVNTNYEPSTIGALLKSNYVDSDCVDPLLYPKGTRLYNLRWSGNNVKEYKVGHISATGDVGDRWVTKSPNNINGQGQFGRLAQRSVIVEAFKSLIDTNTSIRDTETLAFNLIACPGYPEVAQNMVNFNTDIGNTAFVIADTPFRLKPDATTLNNWGSNAALAADNGDDGAVSYDDYMAFFYPSGYTNDNAGNNIVVPPSHMMLSTIINSDAVSYEWFAPAGLNRGGIINATSVGYIDSTTGEFQTVSLYESLRDVLAKVKINPIATLKGAGLVNMGQYTRASVASALDRVNVARLVAYLRRQLSVLAKPYLFEPNDNQTRGEIKAAVENLLLELVGQRALNDFIVVCDTSNNTPARIDRSELYVDIAIEPIKAVEFIYIPLRILNTGAIAAGNLGAGFPGSGS